MKLAKFMASGTGRALRAIVGAILIWWGLGMGSSVGYGVAVFGVVAIAAGLVNFCLIAPLIGAPFRGKDAK